MHLPAGVSRPACDTSSAIHPPSRRTPLLRIAALAIGAMAAPAAALAAPPMALDRLGASLPGVEQFPAARLVAGDDADTGLGVARAPYPCADPTARGVTATRNWAEWSARAGATTVRLITFSYGDGGVARAWTRLRRGIAACPAVAPIRDEQGRSVTATLTVRTRTDRAIRMDVAARALDGSTSGAMDRAIIYQRVGDAIQKVQVSRVTLVAADRRLLRQVADVSRARYTAARADAAKGAPGPLPTAALAVGDTDAPIRQAIAALAPAQKLNVSIGDSFISGEAGRWRGNVYAGSNFAAADAYGPSAYWDTPDGESIAMCHRAKGAEINVPGTAGLNLACSGAITTTKWIGKEYKPGIDNGGGTDPVTGAVLPGQLSLLGGVARQAPIGTVVLSIGGNDMGFSSVMKACMKAYLTPWPFNYHCKDDGAVRHALSDSSLITVGAKVQAAIERTHATMAAAGYADGSWNMIVQNYPVPLATDNRYPETYIGRVYNGACPFYDDDVRWIATNRLPFLSRQIAAAARAAAARTGQPTRFLDLTSAFAGRELCANGTGYVDRLPADQVVGKAERVQMVRVFAPFFPEEAVHPNQLGQQALQACLRLALNGGDARSGRCEAPDDWGVTDGDGLPLMQFTPLTTG